jgi:hypothetical protein
VPVSDTIPCLQQCFHAISRQVILLPSLDAQGRTAAIYDLTAFAGVIIGDPGWRTQQTRNYIMGEGYDTLSATESTGS